MLAVVHAVVCGIAPAGLDIDEWHGDQGMDSFLLAKVNMAGACRHRYRVFE